jgi:hypothetical protein
MQSIVQLWRQGRLDFRLAMLQLLSFAGTLFIIVCSVLLYRCGGLSFLPVVKKYLGS